jgi:hypothetical protein
MGLSSGAEESDWAAAELTAPSAAAEASVTNSLRCIICPLPIVRFGAEIGKLNRESAGFNHLIDSLTEVPKCTREIELLFTVIRLTSGENKLNIRPEAGERAQPGRSSNQLGFSSPPLPLAPDEPIGGIRKSNRREASQTRWHCIREFCQQCNQDLKYLIQAGKGTRICEKNCPSSHTLNYPAK